MKKSKLKEPNVMFKDDVYYRTNDPELNRFLAPGTLANYRYTGTGPRFHRIGRRIYYLGADLNTWMAAQAEEPTPKDSAAA